MDIKGKNVLITGGAAGIGRACSEELLKHGANVAVCDVDSDNGEELVGQLTKRYGRDRIIFCPCDVTDYPQFEEAFETTMTEFGNIDIVINNAGIMNDRFWELEVDVNLNGMIRGTLLALRYMSKERGGNGGIVVNTGSNVCVKPYISIPIYTATKHAIIGFTRSFGDPFHVNMTGVKVIGFCPSATDTNLVREVKKQLLSSNFEQAWARDTANVVSQPVEHVARALVQVIQKANSGSVWLVEKSQPPREITFSVH